MPASRYVPSVYERKRDELRQRIATTVRRRPFSSDLSLRPHHAVFVIITDILFLLHSVIVSDAASLCPAPPPCS